MRKRALAMVAGSTLLAGVVAGSTLLAGYCAFAQPKAAPRPVKLKLPPLPPSTDDFLVGELADAKWMPAQKVDAHIPPGAEVALIGADPMSTGVTEYMKLKPGYKMPAHAHIHLEWSTMIEGRGTWTVGGKRVAALPGTYVVVPSKMRHEFTCDAGAACVLVIRRSGPTEYIWAGK